MAGKGLEVALTCVTWRKNVLDSQWRRHRKICPTCLVTTAARYRYCDVGWEIITELTQVRARLAELQARRDASQPGLF